AGPGAGQLICDIQQFKRTDWTNSHAELAGPSSSVCRPGRAGVSPSSSAVCESPDVRSEIAIWETPRPSLAASFRAFVRIWYVASPGQVSVPAFGSESTKTT